jgi:hypothetical protein
MARPLSLLKLQGQGSWRLWLVVAIAAFAGCGAAAIWQHSEFRGLQALARELRGLQQARLERLVNQYVAEAKEKVAQLPRIGGRAIEVDEPRVRERGYELVTESLEHMRAGREVEETYHEAYEAEHVRNVLAAFAPTIPLVVYLALLFFQWVRNGFAKDARGGE